ncbi:MAG: hypothetical protein Tsb006_6810 [Rickettsiaceae bacterium]
MIKNLLSSFALYVFCLMLVAGYTVVLHTIGHKFWPQNSQANLIIDKNGNNRGSLLLVQNLTSDKYFKGRNADKTSNRCNMALYNKDLKQHLIKSRRELGEVMDLAWLTSSASLLDPYITKQEALRQAPEVAYSRGINPSEIIQWVEKLTLKKEYPFFEMEIVNTTALNALLDGYDLGPLIDAIQSRK